jgi:hypothetical protein
MADRNQDDLDSVLDAALAKYAAVEPRAGLEERILANLQSPQARVPNRAWWPWSVAGAWAAVVVVVLTLAWRSAQPPHLSVSNHSSTTAQSPRQPEALVAPSLGGNQDRGNKVRRATVQLRAVIAINPKLDQFPSPQPLSEQEKMLQSYVAKYPEHAVLVARALTNALSPDQLKGMQAFPVHTGAMDSEEPNDDTTER